MRLVRPHLGRIVVSLAYMLATSGLLVLASTSDGLLVDEWAIVGASIVTLALLLAILATGEGALWLGVGGAWIYAAVMEMLRGPNNLDRAGLSLVFLALAVGGLGAYTAYRRDTAVRV